MNDLTKPQATGISTDLLSRLKSGIAESRASTSLAGFGGKPLLRLLKSGLWVYGMEDVEVEEGSLWAVNPLSLMHGWVAWTNHPGMTKNTMVGEVMVPVFEHKPAKPLPVDGWPFSEQRMFELKCMSGEDNGQEVLHKTSSIGGMRGCDDLLKALQNQLEVNPQYPCPVLVLEAGSYKHSKYGQIFTPNFVIKDWADMTGALASQAKPQVAAPEATQAAPQRRRAAATPQPETVAAPVEPAPTAAVGSPRRRPAGR